jgi:hypothetical protein
MALFGLPMVKTDFHVSFIPVLDLTTGMAPPKTGTLGMLHIYSPER